MPENYKITAYDPEVNEKWRDLIKTAYRKGVLEEVKREKEHLYCSYFKSLSISDIVVMYLAAFLIFGINGITFINSGLILGYFAYRHFKKKGAKG